MSDGRWRTFFYQRNPLHLKSHLHCRSWARATTNSSKDESGSKLMRWTQQPWKLWTAWFVNALNKFINTDLCWVPWVPIWATRCDILLRGTQQDLRFATKTFCFVQRMAYETASRWSWLSCGPVIVDTRLMIHCTEYPTVCYSGPSRETPPWLGHPGISNPRCINPWF